MTHEASASETVWRRRDDVSWRRSIDAVVLMPAGADAPAALPGTAAAVWDLLAEPTTLAELVATLAEVYATDPGAITADVEALLARLEGLGAIEAA
jgi:hypothetical protein